jgi:fatty acid/phospholipid biosynthesis enzyme
MDVKISIDAMGGDFGPEVTMESLKQVLGSSLDVRASVFGDSAVLRSLIDGTFPSDLQSRVDIVHCDTVVDCDDKPSIALRTKQDSSMGQALKRCGLRVIHRPVLARVIPVLNGFKLTLFRYAPRYFSSCYLC